MNRLAYIGIAIAAVLVISAIFAPFIATHDPIHIPSDAVRFAAPSSEHWLGTDDVGRDLFSRIVYGARISLEVGIIVTLVSAVIGMIIGALAGFYGGWIDKILSGYLFPTTAPEPECPDRETKARLLKERRPPCRARLARSKAGRRSAEYA